MQKAPTDMSVKSTLATELDSKGEIVYTNVGDSMYPLIRTSGDLLVIKKYSGNLKKYDIPLYIRSNGKYILHRVIKIKKDGTYVMCGDNRYNKEYGIKDTDIIGVLYSVIRNSKEIKMTDLKCRFYAHLWCDFFWLRKILLIFTKVFNRILKKSARD